MSKLQPKTTKTPTLRFPEFSGEWEFKNLKNVFDRQSNRNSDNQVRFVLTNSATRGIVSQFGYFDKDIANQGNLINYHVVDIDNFVYNPRISKHARAGPLKRNNLKRGIMSPLYTVLKAKKGDLFFLEKYFETTRWHRYMFKIANYGARHDRMNILQDDFMKMPIPFPNLEEQHKIASFLTTVDDWIEHLKKQKESLEEYKKGMLQKLFSQEIRFKDENGQDYPEWEEKRLGEFINLRQEKFNPIIEESNEKDIELESIESRSGLLKEVFDSKDQLSIKNRFYKGDILYGKLRPYLRKYFFATFDGVCSSEFWVIEGKSVEKDYLYLLIQGSRFAQSTEIQSGSKMPRAEWSVVRDFFYNLPTPQEQNKIASFLSSIDDLINLSNQRITLAEEWKKGLMQGMFV